jgi:GAF domain-containing protein
LRCPWQPLRGIAPILQGDKLWGLIGAYQNSSPRQWQSDDMQLLAQIGSQMGMALRLAEIATRQTALAATIDKIRQSLDIETIFQTTTQEVRQLLQADRVAIFRFYPDWSGNFVAESCDEIWQPLVGTVPLIADTHLQETQGGRYRSNETSAVDDIYSNGLKDCHITLLEQFQAKAFAIAPILQGDKLWGLIGAYQNSSPRQWQSDEIQLLAQIGSQMGVALQHQELLAKAQYGTEQQKALTGVIAKIRKSLDLETIFQTTAIEVRQLLNVDRVGIFRFDPNRDWEGEFISEDVADGWNSAIKEKVYDHCFSENFAPLYQQGRVNAISDIHQHEFKDCYIQILTRFQVRANIAAPLLKKGELWGLLCIHQCSAPRNWLATEIEFVSQIADQLGVAIEQNFYIQQVQNQAIQLAEVTEREKAM